MLAATPDHTYNTLTNPIVEQVETMSGSMFVTALPCTTDTGIRLIVMQFQRRATIFDPIDQASNTTALVVAAFVVGMVVITMLLLHWVTKPLLIIQQAMNDLFVDHGHEEESAVSRQSTATGSGKKQAAGAGTSVPVQATAQMEDDAELGESRSQPFDRQQPAVRPKTAKAKRLSSLKQLSRLSEISDLQISFMKMKETIRAFERFVPPVVVQRIIARENKSKELYVEKKEVAIFFSDIQDFTNIAERVHSEVLISMLAQYFEEMTRAIERSHGVLCDFIGDGLMIFWNAPKPLDDFPTRALDCALDQQARVSKLNTAFRSQGWPEFIVRMAVHVGTVHAGNVGSRHRMKLGIVGDNVNLASRLEGLNKRYSSRVIISDDCRRALRKPETYLMRPLESVIVKGRSQSVDVYEVFGHLAVQPAHTVEMVEAYGVVHQMVGAINPQRSAKRDKETVAAACDAYNAKYPKDQMGQLLREKVVRGTFGQPLAMNEK
ncbi:nucleotide cyclase [Geranomyces variabilis]|nr:nucleotide cyclase [Geranomyces variabilis]